MTAQEIQDVGFEKAVFGGYDMTSVDTFLEKVAEEFSSMQKENMELRGKMKILVDKIEEYRGVEDGMRRTLMSAQTIAQDTVDKAKKEAEKIVAQARSATEDKIRSMRDDIALEEKKLDAAKKKTKDFITRMSALYKSQTKELLDLAQAEDLAVPESAALPEERSSDPALLQQPNAPQPILDEEGKPVAEPPAEASDGTRKFNFGKLQFGSEYDPKKVK